MEPTDFVGFDLKPRLLAAITKIGYTKPTVIQQEVIPYLMSEEKKDLVALAQTQNITEPMYLRRPDAVPTAERA